LAVARPGGPATNPARCPADPKKGKKTALAWISTAQDLANRRALWAERPGCWGAAGLAVRKVRCRWTAGADD
jgi:hypothetical protein